MKKKNIKAKADLEKQYKLTWRRFEDAIIAEYSLLIPSGNLQIIIDLPWTREGILGLMKRSGRIIAREQDKSYENGNLRRYVITVEGESV